MGASWAATWVDVVVLPEPRSSMRAALSAPPEITFVPSWGEGISVRRVALMERGCGVVVSTEGG